MTESQFVFYLIILNEIKILFIFFIAKYLEQINQLRVTGNEIRQLYTVVFFCGCKYSFWRRWLRKNNAEVNGKHKRNVPLFINNFLCLT